MAKESDMSTIQINRRPHKTTWIIVSALVLASGAVILWRTTSTTAATQATPTPSTTTAVAPAPATPTPSLKDLNLGSATEVVAQQEHAAKELAQHPIAKPITGVVTERPSFVSPVEWLMMQGVAKQHAQPDQELTRMVNLLRFNKQLELWQDMPKSADAAERLALANQLLDELPQRVIHGDIDLPAAQKLQASLLIDAVPDTTKRRARAETEAQRLQPQADAAASR
jgi:hypothetical protein